MSPCSSARRISASRRATGRCRRPTTQPGSQRIPQHRDRGADVAQRHPQPTRTIKSALEIAGRRSGSAIYEAAVGKRRHNLHGRVQRPDLQPGSPTTPPPSSCATRSATWCSDPAMAELLAPKNHPIGTKRICVDTDYYQTYNRANVTSGRRAATRRSRRSRPTGLRAGDREYQFDTIVFATGFDAMTGALTRIDIRGRNGVDAARQMGGRSAHLSRPDDRRLPEPVHDHRPGQPVGAEQHDRLDRAARGLDQRLPRATCRRARSTASRRPWQSEDAWVEHVNEVAYTTLYPTCQRPGTWAPTSPASRASSCLISAASARIARNATTSRPRATRASA